MITRPPTVFAVELEQLERLVALGAEYDGLTSAQVVDLFIYTESLWKPSSYVASLLAHRSVDLDRRVTEGLSGPIRLTIEGNLTSDGAYFTDGSLERRPTLEDIAGPRCVRCGELMGPRSIGEEVQLNGSGFAHYPQCPAVKR